MTKYPPQNDKNDDGAEAATPQPLCAIAGSDPSQQLAQLNSPEKSLQMSNRMTRTEGSNGLLPELHCAFDIKASCIKKSVNVKRGQVAQLVEKRTEKPRFDSSILPLAMQ